ncbi:MnhB domain-containing protein [Sporosalibacterium faouarense]|uniref:MnhB domain-containing protein n=1 Tax=Sporosalibacterium faouarense TaxID=516123 RepID=UPI00141D0D8A|nr:MnhB domain-containing protein [Sporosalibacterium faouarense]MTI46919.1 hypothetical protein [Bacillota bacterium]
MNSKILFEVSRLVIPFIQVFGAYVILHGHLSPGGGFAGGTIIGASLILYRVIYGKTEAEERLTYSKLLSLMCISLIAYGILKGYSFITGGSHLEVFNIPIGTPGKLLSGGLILPLNICIGIVVSVVIYFLFKLFYEGEI